MPFAHHYMEIVQRAKERIFLEEFSIKRLKAKIAMIGVLIFEIPDKGGA